MSTQLPFYFFKKKKKKKKKLFHFFCGIFACYKVQVKNGFLS
jgi:hypothetical protein